MSRKERLKVKLDGEHYVWSTSLHNVGEILKEVWHIYTSSTELKKNITASENSHKYGVHNGYAQGEYNHGYVYEIEVVVKKVYDAATLEEVTVAYEKQDKPESLENI